MSKLDDILLMADGTPYTKHVNKEAKQQIKDLMRELITEVTDRSDKQWKDNGQFALGMQEAGNRLRQKVNEL